MSVESIFQNQECNPNFDPKEGQKFSSKNFQNHLDGAKGVKYQPSGHKFLYMVE